MKLRRMVHDRNVVILIDSGVSHNFVSKELVQELGLQVAPTKPYGVRLRDVNRKQTQGCCKWLKVQMGAYAVEGEFFLFELGGVDVILGVAWLETLGDVKAN